MEKIEVIVEKFQSDDGFIFDTAEECIHYEKLNNGERKICSSCGGSGETDPYGDGRVFSSCCKCEGKGWLELVKIWK